MTVNNDNLAKALYTRVTRFNASIEGPYDDIRRTANANDFDSELEKLGKATNALLNGLKGAPADSTAALEEYAAKGGNIGRFTGFPAMARIHAATVGRTLTQIAAARPDLAPLTASVRAALTGVHDFVNTVS